jgi:hypothetical protein
VQNSPSPTFKSIMPIDSDLNKVLSTIGLQDAAKDAIAKGSPMCEYLEDLFTDMAHDKTKVKANFPLVVDTKVVTGIDIRRVMFVFDCFLANIVNPYFAWANFTRAVYVADKRSRAVAKAAKTTTDAPRTSTAPVCSTIDFSTDVLLVDAKRQATPVTPDKNTTMKPHLFWKSPFEASNHNSSNFPQLHNTDIVLVSSHPLDVLEFYRELVAATKPPILVFVLAYAI